MEKREHFSVSIAPPVGNTEIGYYLNWLGEEGDLGIKFLSEKDNEIIGALILCGGADIGVNERRDQFEKDLIQQALDRGLPILGVCRGMQILNHFFGGEVTSMHPFVAATHSSTLLYEFDDDHADYTSQYHLVEDIVTMHKFQVNSRHHQFCSKIAPNFKVTHYSITDNSPMDEPVPEAIVDNERNILGVQWHPERRDDWHNGALNEAIWFPLFWLQFKLKHNGKKSN